MVDTLMAGQSLSAGMELVSNNGQYHLVMQGDGNLVLYEPGNVAVWATDTWSLPLWSRPTTAEMQTDGNFVLYSALRLPAWASGTDGSGGDRLVMQSDRNVVIYNPSGAAVWSTGTYVVPTTPTPTPPAGYPRPAAQVPVNKHQRNEVGWGKFMDTNATLYRDGRLICSAKTENHNWTGGLRGRLLVVGVDVRGNACWVSQEMWCTTRCSIPDISCASFGTDTLAESWPTEAAQIVDYIDLYQADAASFVDLRKAIADAIKGVGELAQYLGPLLALL